MWDLEERTILSILHGHTGEVYTLCAVKEGVLVSGSGDNSLIIWSILHRSSTYSPNYVLTGHTSYIWEIIRMSSTEIISGKFIGDLRLWNIDQGLCTRHIHSVGDNFLYQMKQHQGGEVVVSYQNIVSVWGVGTNWGESIKQFSVWHRGNY